MTDRTKRIAECQRRRFSRAAVVLALAIAAATSPGCSGTTRSAIQQAAPETSAANARDSFEIGAEHMRPAFTRETVIRLNAIVTRSLDAIREYDRSIDEIRRAVEATGNDGAPAAAGDDARARLAELDRLVERAQASVADMTVAVASLEAGRERYNDAILAGMIEFVETVAHETLLAQRRLEARLAELARERRRAEGPRRTGST